MIQKQVLEQKVNGVAMEEYIADLLTRVEKAEIEKTECETRIMVLKQLNIRHKNIIDAQRVMFRCAELEKKTAE